MHRAPQLKRRLTAAFTGRLCGNAGSTLRPRAKCRSFSHCSWQARDSRGGARGGHAARGMPQVLGAALALGGVVGLATAADRVLPSRAQCAARGGNKPLAQRHRVILAQWPALEDPGNGLTDAESLFRWPVLQRSRVCNHPKAALGFSENSTHRIEPWARFD